MVMVRKDQWFPLVYLTDCRLTIKLIKNAAARVVTKENKVDHVTPLTCLFPVLDSN